MTAEKPSENNNDPTCDETVEVNNAGDEKNSNSNNKNNNNSSNLDNSKEESSKDPSPSPGTNCITIGLPGKLILSQRKGLREDLFS